MNAPLRLSVQITGDASSLKGATDAGRQGVVELRSEVARSAGAMQAYSAANDAAAQSQRAAQAAAAGRAAAERDLVAAVNSFAGVRATPSDADHARRAADIEAYGRELDNLRARFDPLFAIQMRYEQQVREIDQAHRLGAIGADVHADALQRAQAAHALSVSAMQTGGAVAARSTALATHEVQNLSFQLNDMVMMLASGQSPFVVMMQQGSQVSQIFGSRGVGSIIPAIGAGLASLINPTTLLLGGLTAVGYGGYAAFRMIVPEVESLDDVLARHEKNIQRLGPSYDVAAQRAKAYAGQSAAAIEADLRADVEAAKRAAKEALSDALGDLRNRDVRSAFSPGVLVEGNKADTLRPFRDLIADLRDGRVDVVAFNEEVLRLEKERPDLSGAAAEIREIFAAAVDAQHQVAGMVGEVDPVEHAFGRLADAIDGIDAGEARDELTALMERAKRGAASVEDVDTALHNLSGMTPDLSGAASEIGRLFDAAIAARAAIDALNSHPGINTAEKTHRIGAMDQLQAQYDEQLKFYLRFGDLQDEMRDDSKPRKRGKTEAEREAERLQKYLRQQDELLAKTRLEIALVGESAEIRALYMARLEAEQEIRERGLDGMSAEAKRIRATAEELALVELALERAQEGWGEFEDLGGSSIDRLVQSLGTGAKDIGEVLEGIKDDWVSFILELGVANPLKNMFFGQNNPTPGDIMPNLMKLFGLGGQDTASSALAKAIGSQTVGMMQVQAGNVMVNGGVGGMLGGLGGGFMPNMSFAEFLGYGGGGGGGGGGWLSSIMKFISSLWQFDEGGFTGDVDPSQIAGVVHGKEYVVRAAAVARPGVRPLLEAINSGSTPGYAAGGYVLPRGGSSGAAGMGGVGGGRTFITFNDQNNNRVAVRRDEQPNGDEQIDVLLERVDARMEANITGGRFDDAFGGRYGARPVLT